MNKAQNIILGIAFGFVVLIGLGYVVEVATRDGLKAGQVFMLWVVVGVITAILLFMFRNWPWNQRRSEIARPKNSSDADSWATDHASDARALRASDSRRPQAPAEGE